MESWWIFLRFYLKKNRILSVSIKNKPCNSPEGLQLHEKETPTYFLVHIPKILGTAFFIEQLWWLLLKSVLVSEKDFLKKKINGEILFKWLVSYTHIRAYKHVNCHKSICLSCKTYYHKIFETRSQWGIKHLHEWT